MATTIRRFTKRIHGWYDLASPDARAKGKLWYRYVHDRAEAIADDTGISIERVCGVIAALSPSCEFGLNLRQAEALCVAHAAGADLATVTISTYRKQAEKAKRIVRAAGADHGDVARLLGKRALKTCAFFYNILRPERDLSVTVDIHVLQALDFERQFVQGALWCYNVIVDAFRAVADDLGLVPCELQAIVWLAYKEEHGKQFADELALPAASDDDDDLPPLPDDGIPL